MARAAVQRELPPRLELLCLKALWTLGEGSVNDVRRVVSETKPLAYTTVMTLLDRRAA
jgi:predicted transcriptional regulator